MRILGIDGALGPFSAAWLDTDRPEAARTAVAEGGEALERGMWVIEEVLGPAGLTEIDRVAVGVGPGSFTGLRIALAYAKSLAFARTLPLVGVSSYDALEPENPPLPLLTVVHGRSGIACARLRLADAEPAHRCGTYDEIAAFVCQQIAPAELACAGSAEGVAPSLGERGFTVRAYPSTNEPAALAIAGLAAARLPARTPHAVLADYGEAPAAVVRAARDAR
ncbi:MAG TPA: tRNA (adenosine(37)-N6)-threonylcarbamoyltransferase complex dimerization subunit type 1 TsaB [Candidatus Baltobacteraceae bacterium]